MSKPVKDAPAFDFYPERWLAGVQVMSDAEQLAYLRLLCHQWIMDGLPEDCTVLKRLAGGKGVTEAVLDKFPAADDGKRRNRRLEVIRKEQRKRIANSRGKIDKMNRARLSKMGLKGALQEDPQESLQDDLQGAHTDPLEPVLTSSSPLTTHHPPKIERENAGAPEASLVEQIVAAYPLRDSPMECLESVELALAAGEDAQHLLASVQACVAQIRLAPGGPGNRFVPSARNFFQRQEWRSMEKFKKLSQTQPQSKANASPTAFAGQTNEELAQAWARSREKYAKPKATSDAAASDDEDMKPF